MFKTGLFYSTYRIVLHWLIAILVLFQLLFGESMTDVIDAKGGQIPAMTKTLGSAHYWVGLTILALTIVRVAMRLWFGAPGQAESGSTWMQVSARISHILFYVLLIVTPILGLLAFYVGSFWGDIHSLNKPIFIVMISIHVAATLYHQFWLRDDVLKRMLSPGR